MPDKIGVKLMSRQESSLIFQSGPPRTHNSMQYPRSGFLDQPPAIILVLLLSLLICILAPLRAHAQNDTWPGGTVVAEPNSLDIKPGDSATYSVRLSQKPSVTNVNGDVIEVNDVKDEWFVFVFIDGVRNMDGRYKDLVIFPPFYRSFNIGNWETPKDFRVSRDSNYDPSLTRATSVEITHEVWDHTANCPIHGEGKVEVTLGNSGGNTGNTGNTGIG